MKEFLEKFDLNLILRYFLSGIVFLWGLHSPDMDIAKQDLKLVGIYSLLLGVVIFSVHRNLLFPTVEHFFIKKYKFQGNAEFKILLWKDPKKFFTDQRKEWSSQIHFLYCLTWSLLASTTMICILGLCGNLGYVIENLILAFILFVSALRGNNQMFQILRKLNIK